MGKILKRATIYFDADLHYALRLKAASANQTVSELVNEAVQLRLAEDAEDVEAPSKRAKDTESGF